CKDEYFAANSTLEVEAIVIHFLPDCLGKDILNLPEAYLIPKLLEKAKRGMIINGEAKEKLSALMFSAIDASGLDKIIILLSILKILAETEDYKTIVTGQHTVNKSTESDTIRLNK